MVAVERFDTENLCKRLAHGPVPILAFIDLNWDVSQDHSRRMVKEVTDNREKSPSMRRESSNPLHLVEPAVERWHYLRQWLASVHPVATTVTSGGIVKLGC